MAKHIISFFDRFPPKLCRLLARKRNGHRAMSNPDLAHVSGLTIRTIQNISKRTTWKGMKIDVIQNFSLACGVNLVGSNDQHLEFLRRGVRGVLRSANYTQKKRIQKLISELSHADSKGLPASDV